MADAPTYGLEVHPTAEPIPIAIFRGPPGSDRQPVAILRGTACTIEEARAMVDALNRTVWRPIETAKDGPLELFSPGACGNVPGGTVWVSGGFRLEGRAGGFRGDSLHGEPTHWRPLPAPPPDPLAVAPAVPSWNRMSREVAEKISRGLLEHGVSIPPERLAGWVDGDVVNIRVLDERGEIVTGLDPEVRSRLARVAQAVLLDPAGLSELAGLPGSSDG